MSWILTLVMMFGCPAIYFGYFMVRKEPLPDVVEWSAMFLVFFGIAAICGLLAAPNMSVVDGLMLAWGFGGMGATFLQIERRIFRRFGGD